jgi:DNA repair protein RadC
MAHFLIKVCHLYLLEVNKLMTDKPYQPSIYKFEIVRHTVRESSQTIKSPEDMWQHFGFMEKYDREHVLRVDLSSANEILGYETVGIGTDSMAVVGPKEVFRGALLTGASCIILVHNHPSGHVTPSREDRHIAGKLQLLGEQLEMQLLDFVIIGRDGRRYSFAENEWIIPNKATTLTQATESPHD